MIVMWSGTLANIPADWVLCDGNNGTPDLRSSFVKGAAAAADPGGTGGAATHDHDDHAAQSHSGTTVADHAVQTHSGFAVANHTTSNRTVDNVDGVSYTHTPTQASQHDAVAHSVTQPSNHALQSHVAADNLPVYYAMAFMMKT